MQLSKNLQISTVVYVTHKIKTDFLILKIKKDSEIPIKYVEQFNVIFIVKMILFRRQYVIFLDYARRDDLFENRERLRNVPLDYFLKTLKATK